MDVPDGTGLLKIWGPQTATHPPFGVIRQVLCVVNPPRAVIVPKVVVRVAADANGDLRCTHGA